MTYDMTPESRDFSQTTEVPQHHGLDQLHLASDQVFSPGYPGYTEMPESPELLPDESELRGGAEGLVQAPSTEPRSATKVPLPHAARTAMQGTGVKFDTDTATPPHDHSEQDLVQPAAPPQENRTVMETPTAKEEVRVYQRPEMPKLVTVQEVPSLAERPKQVPNTYDYRLGSEKLSTILGEQQGAQQIFFETAITRIEELSARNTTSSVLEVRLTPGAPSILHEAAQRSGMFNSANLGDNPNRLLSLLTTDQLAHTVANAASLGDPTKQLAYWEILSSVGGALEREVYEGRTGQFILMTPSLPMLRDGVDLFRDAKTVGQWSDVPSLRGENIDRVIENVKDSLRPAQLKALEQPIAELGRWLNMAAPRHTVTTAQAAREFMVPNPNASTRGVTLATVGVSGFLGRLNAMQDLTTAAMVPLLQEQMALGSPGLLVIHHDPRANTEALRQVLVAAKQNYVPTMVVTPDLTEDLAKVVADGGFGYAPPITSSEAAALSTVAGVARRRDLSSENEGIHGTEGASTHKTATWNFKPGDGRPDTASGGRNRDNTHNITRDAGRTYNIADGPRFLQSELEAPQPPGTVIYIASSRSQPGMRFDLETRQWVGVFPPPNTQLEEDTRRNRDAIIRVQANVHEDRQELDFGAGIGVQAGRSSSQVAPQPGGRGETPPPPPGLGMSIQTAGQRLLALRQADNYALFKLSNKALRKHPIVYNQFLQSGAQSFDTWVKETYGL